MAMVVQKQHFDNLPLRAFFEVDLNSNNIHQM
jgi:hypothetical protein